MAESITEGTLNQFNKLVGDFIELDEELATIETDKIDVSVNAPQSGVIKQLLVGEGDVVTVDQEIAEIEAGEQVTTQSEKSKDPASRVQDKPKSEQQPTSTVPAPAHEGEKPSKHEESPKQAPATTPITPPAAGQPQAWGFRPSRAEEKASFWGNLPRINN
jgi:2-oxoglutarate dehydrogenase E2 component (dihydrolipoamide succinyltransferase)